jgi:hypothetical protein
VIGLATFGYITPALRPARFFGYTGTVASKQVQQDAWLRCAAQRTCVGTGPVQPSGWPRLQV